MRILFVAPRYHTNQVEIIRTLLAAGHQVWFHAATIGPTENHVAVVPHVHEPSWFSNLATRFLGWGVNNFWYCPALVSYWRLFRRISPEIVVVRWHNPLFSWLAGVYARVIGCRIIVYEQISPDLLSKVWADGWRGRLRQVRFRTRQRLLNAAWMTPLPGKARLPKGCYFVPFAVRVSEHPWPGPAVPGILEVGKFVPRKNHLCFVAAIGEVVKDTPLIATIVGEASTAPQRQILETVTCAVRDAGLDDVVSIRSNVAHERMSELYDEHTVFVLPAIAEPAAVSPLEAMGHGLPVVVTDTCGTKEYVREGLDGFICASNSAPTLAEAIRKALELGQQPGIRERVAATAAAHFSGAAFLTAFATMVESHFGIPFVTPSAGPGRGAIRA
jgi:glycosyltransferase involved in cell wall biosynthesis